MLRYVRWLLCLVPTLVFIVWWVKPVSSGTLPPAFAKASVGSSYAPMPGFPRVLSGSYVFEAAATTLADLNNDGSLEIIIGSRVLNTNGTLGCGGKVYVYRSEGSLMWESTVRAEVSSSAATADLNGDGIKDVIVGMGAFPAPDENASNECGKNNPSAPGNGGVVALDGRNGNVLWYFNTQDWGEWGTGPNGVLDGVYSSPAVGDINGDGQPEVVFGAWDDCIYLLNRQGNSLWGEIPFTTTLHFCGGHGFFAHDTVYSSPALADFDGDGKHEIVIGSDVSCDDPYDPDLCNRYMAPNGGFLWVIRYDGAVLARRWFDQTIYSSAAIGDQNNDGKLEIVVGTGQTYAGKGYYVTSMSLDLTKPVTEALVTNWQVNTVGVTLSSPALGDLNGDGILDVVTITKYGDWGTPVGPDANNGSYVYAFNGSNGSILWRTHACNNDSIGRSFPINGSPILADINGDGRPEVIFPHTWEIEALYSDGSYYTQANTANGCTNNSGLVSYSGNGSFAAAAAVGDLNGDGKNDLVAPGWWNEGTLNSGALYAWAGVGTASPWPMFHHDASHSGRVGATTPRLSINPTSISVLHQVGDPSNARATLQIRNIGAGSFIWSATAPSGVTISPSSGTISTSVNTTVTISTAGKPVGVYNLGNIVVTATSGGNPAAGSPVSVPVTLTSVTQLYKLYTPFILK